MNGDAYDDMVELDELSEVDEDVEDYGPGEVDEMLDGLVESDMQLAERKRRRRRGRTPPKGVPTAPGRNAYRGPTESGPVTQKQLRDALTRVGVDIKRNATGIKTINTRLNGITRRVDDVVTVNGIQSREIGKLDRRSRADAVLELVGSLQQNGGLTAFQAFKSAVGGGLIGGGQGTFGNPLVLGGIGLLLSNPNILGNLLPAATPPGL